MIISPMHGHAMASYIDGFTRANGVDWRIYQDPNDNWTGAMHGGLAFKGFRESKPGEPLFERGMRHWSLEQLEKDVLDGTLPAVSWVLPPKNW